MIRRLLIILALAAVAAVAVAGPVAAHSKRRVPVGFFGTVLDPIPASQASTPALDSTIGLMARSGVESLRVTFVWGQIEPAPNTFDFSQTDRLVSLAARHRIPLLANLISTPAWASTAPPGLLTSRYAPKSPALFANFATVMVKRYGPNGSFWRANPQLPRVAVRQWQIWNEQGLTAFWASSPWPQTYTRLLRAGYVAIHHADRGAKVVGGSLVAAGPSTQWTQMEALYRAGGKRYFDVVAVHPFTDGSIPVSQSVARAVTIVKYVRNVMKRHGDGHKPIILTELTWPGARGFVKPSRLLGLETTPHGEILRLKAAYAYFATHQRQTGVTQAYWFDWASSFDPNDPLSDVGYRFAGLTRYANGAFIPQAPLRAYAQLAAHYEGCVKGDSGRCH